MKNLTLRIFLERIYDEENKIVFTNTRKTPRRKFPTVPAMKERGLLPKCRELELIARGRSQMNMLDQTNSKYRNSVLLESKNDPDYFDKYREACRNWLSVEQYNPAALKNKLIPWLQDYISNDVTLPVSPPVSPFFKLYEAISSLLQDDQPLAHAEAMMWLMLYAALGNDFKKLQPSSVFFSFLGRKLPLSRTTDVANIVDFLTNTEGSMRNIAVLFGDAGIGKSFVADHVLQILKERGKTIRYYLNLNDLCKNAECLRSSNPSTEEILFVKNAPRFFENNQELLSLSHIEKYKILIATRYQPEISIDWWGIFPILPFTEEQLACFFVSQINEHISQQCKDMMYDIAKEIAKKVECNTDIFIVLCRLICRGAVRPEDVLEKLNQCQTKNIIVEGMPLSTHVYELFFTRDLSIGDDGNELILFLCCMAFLPQNWVFYEQLHNLMENIDPNEIIRQKLLEYGFLKSAPFYNSEWKAYADSQLFYYINDNMRQAIFLSFEGLIDNPCLCSGLYDFLKRLGDGFRICTNMRNSTLEEDEQRYLNLLVWQSIARFLIESAFPLLKLLPDKNIAADLLYTASNLFYFCSIYDDAWTALTYAKEIRGYEDEKMKQSRLQLASVTGNDIDDAECEESAFGFWRCLQKEELWLSPYPDEGKKQRILEELGFTQLRVDQVSRSAEALTKKLEELSEGGWLILRINEEENDVKLYSLKSEQVHIRQIKLSLDNGSSDEEKVINLLQNTYILPKLSWETTPREMIMNGLKISRYAGWGIFQNTEDEKLLSYVDIKILQPNETGYAQIGFAATDVEARSHHYSQFLINHIRLKYPLRGTFFTTHEQNGSMRRAAVELGYEECESKEHNRVVKSIATLRYEKGALVKETTHK